MKMNTQEFENKMRTSMGLQLIIAGMVGLVEDEGHSPHEVFDLLNAAKQNTFHALAEIGSGRA